MASKAVTIVLAVVGGVVLISGGTMAAVAAVGAMAPVSEVRDVDISGVQGLDATVDAAGLTIEFYDGDDARLRADEGSTDGWTLRTRGEELVVRTPQPSWLGWLSPDWLRGDWFDGGDQVTLLLPETLKGIDADLTLNAGALFANGDFDEIEAQVNAGRMELLGSADSVDLALNAGAGSVELEGVDEAGFDVAAGRIDAELTGTAPSEVTIDVSAGNVTLTLPSSDYDVRQDVSAGDLSSELRQDPDSGNQVRVSLSAGSVDLREG